MEENHHTASRRGLLGLAAVGVGCIPSATPARQRDIAGPANANNSRPDEVITEAARLADKADVDGRNIEDTAAFRGILGIVPTISAEHYGAIPDDPGVDSTNAIQNALAAVVSRGGGVVVFESTGTYYANIVATGVGWVLRWPSGRAAFDQNTLRPFDAAKPPLTIGDDVTLTRYWRLENANISGVKIGGQAALMAHQAPAAVYIKGNVAHGEIVNPTFYGGVETLKMRPSASTPVTIINVWGGEIRNDNIDSTLARCVTATYPNTDGYYTDVKFWGTKFAGPKSDSYTVEFDGGALFQATGTYFDMPGGLAHSKGLLFVNGSNALFHGVTLDPLALGQVIIETTDATTDLNRVLQGDFRHGGQKWKNGSGTIFDIPDEANVYFYKPSLREVHMRYPQYIATSTDSHARTAGKWDTDTDAGPLSLFDIDLRVRKGLAVDGILTVSQAQFQGHMTDGLRLDMPGICRMAASLFQFAGDVIPESEQSLGTAGTPWRDVIATQHSDGSGNQVLGVRGAAVADAEFAEGAPTRAEFNALVSQFNALLARVRAGTGHGLIA